MLSAFLLSYISSSLISPINNSSATSPSTISGSDTAPVSVSVSNSPLAYYISVSSSHGSAGTPVSLSYSQDGSSGGILGNVVSSSDNVYLETNSPLTHQLLLSTTSPSTTTKSNNLTGDNTQESGGIPVLNTYIAPVGNTTTSSLNSATTLSSNTWGFALSSTTPGIATNNFNTASEYESTSTATLNTNRYTTVPTNNNQVLLLQDTEPTSTTTIYYGVKANRDIPAGSYSNTVLYTALAEQPSEIRVVANNTMDPAVIDMVSPNQTLTVYTSISTTSSAIIGETATVKFYQGNTEKGSCTSPAVNLDASNFLYVTCTTPVLSAGTYTVELTLTNLGRVLTASNSISYSGNPLDGITTMQTFTGAACNRLPEADTNGNDIYTLKDSRDQKDYKIARLADGNCWMVQNLALDGGRTLHTSDSNVAQDRVLPVNVSASTPLDWNTPQIYSGRAEIVNVYGNKYGNYYNWNAATAGVGMIDTYTTVAESVCPSNWRLPDRTGLKSYITLFGSYGLPTSNVIDTNAVSRVQQAPISLVLAGAKLNSVNEGNVGFYWTRIPDNDANAYTIYVSSEEGGLYNVYSAGYKYYGFSVRCVHGS